VLHECVYGSVLQDVTYPSFVKIVEVSPRDGLQNEKVHEFVVLQGLGIHIFRVNFTLLEF